MTKRTFMPGYGSGVVVATSASSAAATVNVNSIGMLLTNLGSFTVFVRLGEAAGAATTADVPVPVGTQVAVSKSNAHRHLSHISPDGAGSLHYMLAAVS